MADSEPILVRNTLGALRPASGAATDLLASMKSGEMVRIEVKKLSGNVKRMALYWCVLRVACEQLSDAVDGVLSTRALHRWLKREYGIAKPIVSKKTGEILDYDYDSISFPTMTEMERTAFVDWTIEKLSHRLGCDVTTLRHEAAAA